MYARPKRFIKPKIMLKWNQNWKLFGFLCLVSLSQQCWQLELWNYNFGRNLNYREKDVFVYFFRAVFNLERYVWSKIFLHIGWSCICDEPQASIKQHLSHSFHCSAFLTTVSYLKKNCIKQATSSKNDKTSLSPLWHCTLHWWSVGQSPLGFSGWQDLASPIYRIYPFTLSHTR